MHWRLKRKQNKPAYLRYRKGDIYEEEKVSRKELHEGERFVSKEVYDESTLDTPTPSSQTVYLTEEEATEEKMEQLASFNGKIWLRLATSLLSLLLIVYGIGFISQYAITVINEPAPKEQVEEPATNENADGNWKETWDSFWTGVFPEKTNSQPDESPQESATPKLHYTDEAKKQMNSATDIHAGILEQFALISYDATRYNNRLINSVSFSGNLVATQSKVLVLQQQLNQSVGDEHPLYENLSSRLNSLLSLITTLQDAKRSQVVELTNQTINTENPSGEAFLASFTDLLDQYGVPYTQENGSLSF